MKYSAKQQLASLINRDREDNRYMVNKREKGQQKVFICNCCGKEFDFSDSTDYVGAVEQWEGFGGKCYACGRGLCHCQERDKNNAK